MSGLEAIRKWVSKDDDDRYIKIIGECEFIRDSVSILGRRTVGEGEEGGEQKEEEGEWMSVREQNGLLGIVLEVVEGGGWRGGYEELEEAVGRLEEEGGKKWRERKKEGRGGREWKEMGRLAHEVAWEIEKMKKMEEGGEEDYGILSVERMKKNLADEKERAEEEKKGREEEKRLKEEEQKKSEEAEQRNRELEERIERMRVEMEEMKRREEEERTRREEEEKTAQEGRILATSGQPSYINQTPEGKQFKFAWALNESSIGRIENNTLIFTSTGTVLDAYILSKVFSSSLHLCLRSSVSFPLGHLEIVCLSISYPCWFYLYISLPLFIPSGVSASSSFALGIANARWTNFSSWLGNDTG